MKNRNPAVILSFFIPVFIMLFSFESYSQFRYGLTGGGSLSSGTLNPHASIDTITRTYFKGKPIIGYYFGATAEVDLGNVFLLRSALYYDYKGWDTDLHKNDSIVFSVSHRINSFTLPVTIVYTASLANGRFYLGTGPYVSYRTKGKEKWNFADPNSPDTAGAINFTGKYGIRFDYGLQSGFGYKFNSGLFMELGYDFGFKTLYKKGIGSKIRVFKIGAGMLINKKR